MKKEIEGLGPPAAGTTDEHEERTIRAVEGGCKVPPASPGARPCPTCLVNAEVDGRCPWCGTETLRRERDDALAASIRDQQLSATLAAALEECRTVLAQARVLSGGTLGNAIMVTEIRVERALRAAGRLA